MKVVLSCIGRFHHFDLARQLHKMGVLETIYTGYPRFKLRHDELPRNKIDTFPWLQAIYMSQGRWPAQNRAFSRWLGKAAARAHDEHVERSLRPCDVFVGLSGHNTRAGKRAQQLGAKWVCDRGSSHILYQNDILVEEHKKWGVSFEGVPTWAIENELAEYARCDLITVPSGFAARTFIEAGVAPAKIRRVPYGVDLSRFQPVCEPANDRFDVIFVGVVSLQKGIPYLVEAFRRIRHPNKRLRIIGSVDLSFASWVKNVGDKSIEFLGHVPQVDLKRYLSISHVFVLPSIQDGFGMVMAQAMACGCPVIASENTGGPDLITDGMEGQVVPIRDVCSLVATMQRLVDEPELRNRMSQAAIERVKSLGGWNAYGAAYFREMKALLGE